MPTPAEVRAMAEADPHYEGFIGDGASVPWEFFPPNIGLPLYLYKVYLDNLAPDAFKLHDFLYSNEATYLPITKEDADFTLFAELLPFSLHDATIVYAAVRLGNAYYHPRTRRVPANRDNMGLTRRFNSMANFKFTMLFQQATNINRGADPAITRVAGWSESWYRDYSSAQGLLSEAYDGFGGTFPSICQTRAALLPIGGAMVGQRVQTVPVTGAALTASRVFPGGASWPTDVPSMGLLCTAVPAGSTKIRRFTIRDIPDLHVIEGEYSPTAAYKARVDQYFEALRAWSVRGRDSTVPAFAINNVSGVGILTSIDAMPFVPGERVQILGTVDATGRKRSGVFQLLAAVPGGNQATIAGWPFGLCQGGNVRSNSFLYSAIGAGVFGVSRVVNRKVGRPFVGYRGRASKRRRTA